MTPVTPSNDDHRIRLRRALEALRDMRAKLETARREHRQPIAIIGIGCRLPGGVRNPDDYWRLLSSGRDAIGEVPADRWDVDAWYDPDPNAPGKIVTRCGGFLDRVDEFDPQFFGIAPREADFMDPQQRLLLEVAWESLEHAALAADDLRGTATGVFVGISSGEYAEMLMAGGPASINHYAGSGNANSVAAGRISYVLDLVGPAVAVDTACSSSLVAVDLACQSLRARQCDMALAGGVNVLLTPTVNINHSRARMLAPDGRCKTFDASADGFVRSEGCGMVVLKRLDEALADRDNILAVIRGTAANQDGHTSGLTVPNGPSQESVIRRAQLDAGVSAADVSYVEAHGTGTSLGDPIELNALKNVFAPGRAADRPLLVGSVKTNVGHMEAAAGIAGLIKVVLSLRHQVIPPHLHCDNPTPRFDWDGSALRVPNQNVPWVAAPGTPRLAGVSSFGFGGTNAHLIIQEPPERTRPASPSAGGAARATQLLPLSAQSSEAARQLAAMYATHLRNLPELALEDVCLSAGAGRSHFRHRAAALVDSLEQAAERLSDVAANRASSEVVQGLAGVDPPKIAFLFTGQGSQYAGMGRELYETEPVFRESMQRCDEILRPHLEVSLLDVVYSTDDRPLLLNQTAYTQPALFAVEYSLAELWKSWGIVPDAVMGHSVGEYAAACLAGVFSLEDGLQLIAARGRLMQALPAGGAMAAVFADQPRVSAAIDHLAKEVSIAAINGPRNTVVSGSEGPVNALLRHLRAGGVESQTLSVSHAFHSPLIEPMIAQFAAVAAGVTWAAPGLDFISNLTGQLAGDGMIDADYWCRHTRQPVQFAAGVETLHRQGYRLLVEVGPKPVLLGMGRQCVTDDQIRWLPSLRPGRPDREQLLQSLAELYTQGAKVRWAGLAPAGRRIELPTYPFQRRRHWAAVADRREAPVAAAGPERRTKASSGNPLLGERLDCASRPQEVVFQARLGDGDSLYLVQHRVFGRPIMPAAGYLSMARSAAMNVFKTSRLELRDVVFHEALAFAQHGETTVQLIIDRASGAWKVYSRRDPAADPPRWTLHASGTAVVAPLEPAAADREPASAEDIGELRDRINVPLSRDDFYQTYADRGVEFGPAFRAVGRLWSGDRQALGQIALSEELDASRHQDDLHPVLLDAAAQVVGAAFGSNGHLADGDEWNSAESLWLQSGIERYRGNRPPVGDLWAHATVRQTDQAHTLVADVRLLDQTGAIVAEIIGLRARPATAAKMADDSASQAEHYELEWVARPRAAQPAGSGPNGSGVEQPRRSPADEPAGVSPSQTRQAIPADVAATLERRLDTALAPAEIVAYAELLSSLEALSPLYVARALRRMGWCGRPDDRFETRQLQQQLGVLPQYSRLFDRLLLILADERVLHREGEQWEIISDLPDGDLDRRVADLQGRWPASAELELLDRCGRQLAGVLRGECQPLDLIFPNGDMTAAARVYGDSPGVHAICALLAAGIEQALKSLPARGPLRILEIGAGTGGTTSYVLPHLPADRTEYVFTDISRQFLPAARAKFAKFPFVRYQLLDIEQSPSAQGFDEPPFDLIIASNVLHATRNLRDTVGHVGQLLAPGGLLWLLENVAPSNWVELIWGLTDGWWRFEDDLRDCHPLLSSDQWRQLLQASGFDSVASVTANADRHGHLARQGIIVAQRAPAAHVAVPAPKAAIQCTVGQPADGAVSRPLSGDQSSAIDEPAWLLLAEPGEFAEALAASLAAHGNRGVLVRKARQFAQHSDDAFDVNPERRADFERLIEHVAGAGRRLAGVVHLWGQTAEPLESLTPAEVGCRVHESFMGLAHLVRALAGRSFEAPPPLWLVTRAAQPVSARPGRLRPDLSTLWSIGKVVALEHPNLWGGMLDLDPDPQPDEVAAIVNELLDPDGEDQVALRGGDRLVPRLVHRERPPVSSLPVRSDASYLITGGCGAFGLAAAAWLVEQGARNLVLLGRSGANTASARQAITGLESAGAHVLVVRADVCDLDAMSSLFQRFDATLPRLAGIVHAAGRPGYRLLAELDDETVRDVLAAKVTGTWVLHTLATGLNLDFFVGCSSMVSVWGSQGQSHYGAANQFLDVVAHYRRELGLPGLSVNWGPLTGGGMLPPEDIADLRRIGVLTTSLQQAVASFARLLGSEIVQTTLVDIDWPVFKGVYEARRKRPLFEQLGAIRGADGPAADALDTLEHPPRDAGSILERLVAAPPSECRELLSDHVQFELAGVLGLADRPDCQTGFFDMGLDSLTAMELRTRLEKTLHTTLPSTLAFDYSTVETLTEFLAREVTLPREQATAPPAAVQPPRERVAGASDIEQMSDEEVELLLIEKLERLGHT